MSKSESVILCEGYYDRAFWTGWLEYLGCENPGRKPRIRPKDPWKQTVGSGDFAFYSSSRRFVRVTPCDGKQNILGVAEGRLKDRDKGLLRLVLNVDSDVDAEGGGSQTPGLSRQAVKSVLQNCGKLETNEHGDFLLDRGAPGGETVVSVIEWAADDAMSPGLPGQQTLERLVCAALVAAYPDRGPVVQEWLDSRPNDAPQSGAKEFAWSHMAGWFAELGCDAFYRTLWDDDAVADKLKSRLVGCGAWRIAEALAE